MHELPNSNWACEYLFIVSRPGLLPNSLPLCSCFCLAHSQLNPWTHQKLASVIAADQSAYKAVWLKMLKRLKIARPDSFSFLLSGKTPGFKMDNIKLPEGTAVIRRRTRRDNTVANPVALEERLTNRVSFISCKKKRFSLFSSLEFSRKSKLPDPA